MARVRYLIREFFFIMPFIALVLSDFSCKHAISGNLKFPVVTLIFSLIFFFVAACGDILETIHGSLCWMKKRLIQCRRQEALVAIIRTSGKIVGRVMTIQLLHNFK